MVGIRWPLCCISLIAGLCGCGPNDPPIPLSGSTSAGPGIEGSPSEASEQLIRIVDELGQPVPQAEILFGTKPGEPFQGNYLYSDEAGQIHPPAAWTSTVDVSVAAPGYVRRTLLGQAPGAFTVQLSRHRGPPTLLSGKTSGFGSLKKDGILDVSIVFPALSRADLLTLDLTHLLSPDVDRQSIYGQEIEIPANVSIPDQSESVFLFLPISIDKPQYRIEIGSAAAKAGSAAVAAVSARFDFKDMINDLQAGKSFFDLINHLKFRSYSLVEISTEKTVMSADLPIGGISLKTVLPVQVGRIEKGYAVIATALADHGGDLVVTDVKRLMSGEKRSLSVSQNPAAGATSPPWIVRTLKRYEPTRTNFAGADYEALSSIALPANQSPSADFLPLIEPVKTSGRRLILSPPSVPPGLVLTETHVTLYRISIVSRGAIDLVVRKPVWDFVKQGTATEIDLPVLSVDPWAEQGIYRWELRFSAGPLTDARPTHTTRNSIDFRY